MRLHLQEFNNNELLLMKKNKRHPILTATILLDTFVPIKKALKSAFFMQSKRIFLSLLLLTSLFSEEIKDGFIKKYHDNGQLESETTYKNGKLDGPYKTYHENGQLREEGTYNNGTRIGLYRIYYDNGQLLMELNYIEYKYDIGSSPPYWRLGKQEGPSMFYYKNGQLKQKKTYKDGKEHGPSVQYYENGQLYSEGNYLTTGEDIHKDGQEYGLWKFYWENGQL